jgi:tellurite resistance protein
VTPEATPITRTLTTIEQASADNSPNGRPRFLVTANLFGVPFGLAVLAQCWSAARELIGVPSWPADLLWLLTAVVYLLTLAAYGNNVVRTGRSRTEAGDLTFGPFTALIFIIPMMLGLALAGTAPRTGTTVFFVCLTLVVAYGGWLSGQWIIEARPLVRWHPAYFLPTVAGPLVAAAGCGALGFDGLALLLFGCGVVSWIVLGSIILVRLFTQPMLPTPLVPTLAIEVAPPAVAGNAWFLINDNRADTVAYLLAGYALLMVLVQVRLIPLFVKVPFVAGMWAFAFSYAAVFAAGIRWLAAEPAPAQRPLTYCLLAAITSGFLVLAIRTVIGLVKGTFLPRLPPMT